MRLPRSGSPSVTRALPLGALITGCRTENFTGAVTCMLRGSPASLLFRDGVPVCAEYGRVTGVRALEEMEKVGDVVTAEISLYSGGEVEVALLFNDASKVTTGPCEGRPATTTIHAVRVGQRSRPAVVKVVRTVETGGDAPVSPPVPTAGEKKNVLNPESVKALKKMQKSFMTDASDLLKEMHMEHLIVRPEKRSER
ncbi:hypothetical protein [uncultured Methanofollis sp.]|uniref:hypothetical protein n=1 Tax=uncultured Methanofollis sp. TaxID=262500 RepID=UPI0026340FDF|nr:hypothetical protein [uncultured Methanofollis sp.]